MLSILVSGETLELIIEGKSTSPENVYTISKINIVESTDPFVRIEAEDFTDSDGPKTGNTGDGGGGQNSVSIKPGHWSMYKNLDLTNVSSINAHVATTYDDAKVEVRINASDGILIGIIDVPNTGAWQTYKTASAYIEDITGIYDVYLVYTTTENANVCNINWFEFSDAFVRAPIDPFSQFEAEYYDAKTVHKQF